MANIGVLQLDFVNVLLPAHFLMIWSRLGAYERTRFERFLYDSGEYTEQWAHEASVVAVSDWPLLSHRREAFKPWQTSPLLKMKNRNTYLEEILERIANKGSLTSSDLPAIAGPKRKPGDWHRSVPRAALDYHFGKGQLAVERRLKNFQRVYDLPKRLIAAEHRDRSVSAEDAQRALLRKAIRCHGIATCHDIADYYRMSSRDVAPIIAEFVEQGIAQEVAVEGWTSPAYLDAEARCPRVINAASLLSPFDPVVWFRPRAERLFGFEYRIEIYVPESRRRWGYYVLPFLEGDRITARVDLKADRKANVLCVQHAHLEEGASCGRTCAALARELRSLADWLGLESVAVKKASTFDKALADVLGAG